MDNKKNSDSEMTSIKDVQMEVDVGSEDDEYDYDDELSTYPYNQSGGGKGNAMLYHTVDEKRAHHNFLERKRRDHIKDSFNELRDAVPDIQGEKSSRAQILHKATEYISLMNHRIKDHSKDIDKIKQHNDRLEHQIQQLEAIRKSKEGGGRGGRK